MGAFFRPRDAKAVGVDYRQLQRLVAQGNVERVEVGLYRLIEVEPDQNETVAMVAAAVPGGIVCLLTALRIHGLGTQSPHQVWIALERGKRTPVRLPSQTRIVRFSGAMTRYGVIQKDMLGVPVRITSPARTVVDCFRFRRLIGLDVAMEALADAFRDRKVSVDQIWRAAEVCRIRTVIGPYLDSLAV